MSRCLSDHAYARYRQRHDLAATRDEAQLALDGGELRFTTPIQLEVDEGGDCYIVNGPAVFVMRRVPGDRIVAVTCLSKWPRLRLKADRRAARLAAHEGDLAA